MEQEQKETQKQYIRIGRRGEQPQPFTVLVNISMLMSAPISTTRDATPDAEEEEEEHRQYLWWAFPSITEEKAMLKVSRSSRSNQIRRSETTKTDHLSPYVHLCALQCLYVCACAVRVPVCNTCTFKT